MSGAIPPLPMCLQGMDRKKLFFNIYEMDLIHSGRVIDASESRLTPKEWY